MIKKVTFGVKSYFIRKRDVFPLKVVNFRKNFEIGIVYAVLEKNNYIVIK